ncbi:Quinoprotein glucose dehydrogenase B [Halioglobus japonicus]|nr:Quinoprotein glucose dehydrogenase B [Halioglobus japonicus]
MPNQRFFEASIGRGVRFSARTLLALSVLAGASYVQASAGGRSGFSGDPSTNGGATCSVCHAPDGATPPAIGVAGPDTMSAGQTMFYYIVMLGGPAQTGGIDISVQDGIGELTPLAGDLQLMNGDLTHTGPKDFSAGAVVFRFLYTAPNYDTEVTLHVAGNSTDGNLDLLGDAIATTSWDITIENGFEDPPEPPTPPLSDLTATEFATGLSNPIAIENAGDARLFVAEQAGMIRVLESDGTLVPAPFLDITAQVDDEGSEMGLLGIAFHPDYANNGYFYVYYTRDTGEGLDRSRVSRFTVSSGDPDVADPNSELVLLEFEQPYANHNGGDLHFGPSGFLHIAVGDGGSGGDPHSNGQNTATLLGKMLRIDVDTPPAPAPAPAPAPGTGPDCDISQNSNYSIPEGNAFNNGTAGEGCDEIFVLGVRNPWRFAFDSLTGGMWIADVGQRDFEEINYIPPGNSGGINLGWRCYEGAEPYKPSGCDRVYLPPVYAYSHATSGCSVTGGRVYRGQRSPHLQGQYFFTDFCQSSIQSLRGPPDDPTLGVALPLGELAAISTFGEDIDGELYVAELRTGTIYRLASIYPPGC